MSLLSIVVLAFSMSADAFAAALGKGSALDRPPFGEALRCGLIFGLVEAATPVVGWAAGSAASSYIAAIDRWLALAVLGIIGIKMIWDGSRRPAEAAKPKRHPTRLLVATAIGTSIDALAVGVTLALLDVGIMMPALAIGLATFAMTTLGILLGRVLGEKYGRIAEILGGTALLAIGIKIALGHAAFRLAAPAGGFAAQLETLDLAGRGLGQFVDKGDPARAFEGREQDLGVAVEGAGQRVAGRDARFRHDKRLGLDQPVGCGGADHRSFEHIVMGDERRLDLGRRDIHAVDLEHVVAAAAIDVVAVPILVIFVPGAGPWAEERLMCSKSVSTHTASIARRSFHDLRCFN